MEGAMGRADERGIAGPFGGNALRGVRIADLTIITAGPNATQMLADLGAEVVKVESGQNPDPFRFWHAPLGSAAEAAPEPWNWSCMFNTLNRNKLGVVLDLKHPLGKEAFLRLVKVSDAVTENFRQGVMDRLGLGFDDLRRVNPRIILLSIGSQGSTGPEKGYRSYGSTLDALSGLMSLTGYEDSPPVWSGQGMNYPDQVASIFSAGLLLAAVRYRDRTGQACFLDLSQREFVTTMIGEHVLETTINGTTPRPRGNRRPGVVPQGCFPCEGEDAWVAISVETDAQWRALCEAIGRPELGTDDRYRTADARAPHRRAGRGDRGVDAPAVHTRGDAGAPGRGRAGRCGAVGPRHAERSAAREPRILRDRAERAGGPAAAPGRPLPDDRDASDDHPRGADVGAGYHRRAPRPAGIFAGRNQRTGAVGRDHRGGEPGPALPVCADRPGVELIISGGLDVRPGAGCSPVPDQNAGSSQSYAVSGPCDHRDRLRVRYLR